MIRPPMHVVFRCDASVSMGTGHVSRCLALADAIASEGGRCDFICRDLPGHRMADIASRRHGVISLIPPPRALEPAEDDPYGAWLGVSRHADAQETRPILDRLRPDRIIVDHYALDAEWEQAAVPFGLPIMVIDDLADRAHLCDILLDQNLGRQAGDYDGLVPVTAARLIGPQFALLRPEFAAARPASLARRRTPELRSVVVSMGGIDRDNASGAILRTLAEAALPGGVQVTVVLGSGAPFVDRVRELAVATPFPVSVEVGVADMATLLGSADLAIGAGGNTSWERCCLGLPALLLVVADNQIPAGRALAESGAALLIGDLRVKGWMERLHRAIAQLSPETLSEMSSAAAAICDGGGCSRTIEALAERRGLLRPATLDDVRRVWEWRYANGASEFYRNPERPDYPDHEEWFARALADRRRLFLIFCRDGIPLAHVRFDSDPDDPRVAHISICVACEARGQGIGTRAIRSAISATALRYSKIIAEVHEGNTVSRRTFARLGFEDAGNDGPFRRLVLCPFGERGRLRA